MNSSAPIDCLLETSTRDARVEQIHTGLAVLHFAGAIRLRQRVTRTNRYAAAQPLRPVDRRDAVNPGFVQLVVNGGKRLHFDLGDGPGIDEVALGDCDFYFKRSYHAATVARLGARSLRIRPLGLNFPVFPDRRDRFALARILRLSQWRDLPADLLRWADTSNRISFLARRRHFIESPRTAFEPKVLFLARAWDPRGDPGRPPEKVAEFEEINETRAECIRALRREFGPRFLGGLSRSSFAVREFADVVVPESFSTSRRAYFLNLRDFPICVATSGLHGSIGWKFGEYVAFGKAIVSEPLRYRVPGDLREESNYLAFDTVDRCIEKISYLISHDDERRAMMEENLRYYREWGDPESLVWSAISSALSCTGTDASALESA